MYYLLFLYRPYQPPPSSQRPPTYSYAHHQFGHRLRESGITTTTTTTTALPSIPRGFFPGLPLRALSPSPPSPIPLTFCLFLLFLSLFSHPPIPTTPFLPQIPCTHFFFTKNPRRIITTSFLGQTGYIFLGISRKAPELRYARCRTSVIA